MKQELPFICQCVSQRRSTEEGVSDIQKLRAKCSTCIFVKHLRQPELVLPSPVQDYSPCYMKESKTLIQTLVSVQSYTGITCTGITCTAACKHTSYLPENYISQMQRL